MIFTSGGAGLFGIDLDLNTTQSVWLRFTSIKESADSYHEVTRIPLCLIQVIAYSATWIYNITKGDPIQITPKSLQSLCFIKSMTFFYVNN